jgi:acetyl-CoA acetyltransferase
VAVKNHFNESLNPKAHFRSPINEETVESPMVVDPLGLFDCCPTTDRLRGDPLPPEIARDLRKITS